jgi:CRISPR-associated protein Cas5t
VKELSQLLKSSLHSKNEIVGKNHPNVGTPNHTFLKALHIHLEAFTSFSRRPLLISGTQITMPVPPYSTLLGLISCVAGKEITYKDTRIGFEFHCVSDGPELMRTNRLMTVNGELREHVSGQGILTQMIHFIPRLDLYLTNTDLKQYFDGPKHFPRLGRSQDLMWIKRVEEIELEQVHSGAIGPTLLPREHLVNVPPSYMVNHAEYFHNDKTGYCRKLGPLGHYQALNPTIKGRYKIRVTNNSLFHPSNLTNKEDVIYVHQWKEDNN